MRLPSFIKSLLTCNLSQPIKCYFHREDTMRLQDQSFINAATISGLLTSFPETRRLWALNLTNKGFSVVKVSMRSLKTTSKKPLDEDSNFFWLILNPNNAFKITLQKHGERLNAHYQVWGVEVSANQSLNWSSKELASHKCNFAHGRLKWGPGPSIMATLGLITH